MNQLAPVLANRAPTLVAAAGESAQERFIEFFTANIRNRNTRRAYAQAVRRLLGLEARPPACDRSRPCSRFTSPATSRN